MVSRASKWQSEKQNEYTKIFNNYHKFNWILNKLVYLGKINYLFSIK